MSKILCVGDIMLDVTAVLGGAIQPGLETRATISAQGGGAAANVASWLVVSGTPAYLTARIGDDAAGKTVSAELDLFGVEHSRTVVEGARTGVVVVLVGGDGERTMFPDSGANAGLSPADLPPLDGFSAVYLSGYSLINPASRVGTLEIMGIVSELSLPIIFDPSTVGVLLEVGIKKVREWLTMVDVVVLNEEEAQFLSGKNNPIEAAADLLTLTPLVVVKRGANGALAQSRGSTVVQISALQATVVDTTGAGDAFAAGFIQAWIAEKNLAAALQSGAALAARCVEIVGSRPVL